MTQFSKTLTTYLPVITLFALAPESASVTCQKVCPVRSIAAEAAVFETGNVGESVWRVAEVVSMWHMPKEFTVPDDPVALVMT